MSFLRLTALFILAAGIGLFRPAAAKAEGTITKLPDFHAMAATTDKTRPMEKADLLGHVWVADFFFASCGDICPVMTRRMSRLQHRLPKDVWLVSFTVDPKHDTLADLQGYARDNNADPDRWFFLRMKKQALAKLMYYGFKTLGAYQEPFDESTPIPHSGHFLLVDKQGRLRSSFDGTDEKSLETIPPAVMALLKEK